jgi:hypothetical protein
VKLLPKDIKFLANGLIMSFERELASQLKLIGDILVDDVKEHIDSDVYDKYDPVYYARTGNLKRATKKSPIDKNITGMSIDIYSDDEIAKSSHMYDSKNQLESYASVVESGMGYDYGSWNGHPWPFQTTERPYMKNAIENKSDDILDLIDKAVGDAIRKL